MTRTMPAPPDDARTTTARVLGVEPCGDDGVLLAVRPERDPGPVRASRFFMLKRLDGLSPLIPRPFSIYRQEGERLEFLLKVMGRGTAALAALREGDEIRLVGPLGNGWPALDGDGPPWVMLAGGVGSAPFLMAIEQALAGMDGKTPARPDQLHYLFRRGDARAALRPWSASAPPASRCTPRRTTAARASTATWSSSCTTSGSPARCRRTCASCAADPSP